MKQSIDWVSAQDLDQVSTVFAEMNFLKQIVLFSDKCSLKELDKMQEDFERDLLHSRTTKCALGKYLKNTEKKLEAPKEPIEDESTLEATTDKKKENEVI